MGSMIRSACCIAAVSFFAPLTGLAQAGDARELPRRTIFTPAAGTTPAGGFDVTVYELALPSVSYGVADGVQLGFAATRIPTAETILIPGAKARLAQSAGITLTAFGAVATDLPARGRTGWLPMVGLVGTRCGERACGSAVVLHATPTSARGTDRVLDIAMTGSWRAAGFVEMLGEQHVRVVVPETQVGATSLLAARMRWRAFALDVGWLLDIGVVGPAFPLVGPEGLLGPPGIPVINLAATFH